MSLRRFSLSHLTAPVHNPLETADIAIATGYDHVGLRLRTPDTGEPGSPLVGNPALRRELLGRLNGGGVSVLEIEAWMLCGGQAPTDDEAVFETAAALGAPRLLAVGDRAGRIGMDELCDRFADLCERAAAFELGVDFEPIAHRVGGTLTDALTVVAAGRPWGSGLTLDTLHIHRMGLGLEQLGAIDRTLLHTLQFCDAPGVALDLETWIDHSAYNRMVPGEGELPLRDYLRSLPHDLPIALEVPMQGMATRWSPLERARRVIAGARHNLRDG